MTDEQVDGKGPVLYPTIYTECGGGGGGRIMQCKRELMFFNEIKFLKTCNVKFTLF